MAALPCTKLPFNAHHTPHKHAAIDLFKDLAEEMPQGTSRAWVALDGLELNPRCRVIFRQDVAQMRDERLMIDNQSKDLKLGGVINSNC